MREMLHNPMTWVFFVWGLLSLLIIVGTFLNGESTMTRKDYVLISDVIRNTYVTLLGPKNRAGLEMLATSLADALQRDNPQFDKKRFLAACGLES